MQYGKFVAGKLEPRFVESAGLSAPGGIYQADIETDGIPDEAAAIAQLLMLEEQVPDLKLLYINTNVSTGVITMQFTDLGPDSFSFIGLMGAMPVLLGLILVAVVAYTLWTVYSSSAWLLWAMLALGAGVAFFYFTSGKISMPTAPIRAPAAEARTGGERERLMQREDAAVARKQKLEDEQRQRQYVIEDRKLAEAEKQAKEEEKRAQDRIDVQQRQMDKDMPLINAAIADRERAKKKQQELEKKKEKQKKARKEEEKKQEVTIAA